MLSAERM
jgi:hypothetical protein